jgi:hypothetical protein
VLYVSFLCLSIGFVCHMADDRMSYGRQIGFFLVFGGGENG